MNTKELLFKTLEKLSIKSETFTHQPVFTCDEAMTIKHQLPPHAPIKNLFLKDKKKQFWLICALHSTQIQLKALAKFLPAQDLRFASAEDLLRHLDVTPGSVTPLALINDAGHVVNVILDQQIFEHPIIGIHPLSNDATTLLTPQDLQTFIKSCDNKVRIVDFSTVQE